MARKKECWGCGGEVQDKDVSYCWACMSKPKKDKPNKDEKK